MLDWWINESIKNGYAYSVSTKTKKRKKKALRNIVYFKNMVNKFYIFLSEQMNLYVCFRYKM